ncbi:MAG: hypothetical protein ACTTKL_01125 [Treponema sp.]
MAWLQIISRKYKLFFLIVAVSSASLYAETFRVRKLYPVRISGNDAAEQVLTIGINDGIALFMPQDARYLEGVEIKMQIPQEVSAWRDSVACSVYDKIKPVPSEAQIDYSGTRIFVSALPAKLSWILHIPLNARNSLKDNQYISKVGVIPNVKAGYTFLRFQPAMKGIPEETFNAKLNLTIKPLLINKGMLALAVKPPADFDFPYAVLIDDKPVEDSSPLLLEAGMHTLNIQSDDYRAEMRSVLIEQAKTSELTIELKSLAPTLTVTAPDNAEVFLDDAPYPKTHAPTLISEGEHRLRFIMGDYEVIRTLTIHKGKAYAANLSVDLKITED